MDHGQRARRRRPRRKGADEKASAEGKDGRRSAVEKAAADGLRTAGEKASADGWIGLRTAGEKATADGEDGWNGSRAADGRQRLPEKVLNGRKRAGYQRIEDVLVMMSLAPTLTDGVGVNHMSP